MGAQLAQIVVLPGALPHVRCGASLLVNNGGVLVLHELSIIYGVSPTPAKIFSYVTRYLLAALLGQSAPLGKKKTKSSFANLFARKKDK